MTNDDLAEAVGAYTGRAETIAKRDRAGDLEELRIERIAIEGEIEAANGRLKELRRHREQIDASIVANEAYLAEQRARLGTRIDAIAALERSSIGGGQ